jgi:hypothetical protein
LRVVLVGGGKRGGCLRELELQPIALMAKVDELAGEILRRAPGLRTIAKPADCI